jgi:hypothetical protein
MTSTSSASSPVRLTGELDPNLSRWLWLVKMFLAIPHYLVLALLLTVFVVTTVMAGFAILFTRRYPRPLFDFNWACCAGTGGSGSMCTPPWAPTATHRSAWLAPSTQPTSMSPTPNVSPADWC